MVACTALAVSNVRPGARASRHARRRLCPFKTRCGPIVLSERPPMPDCALHPFSPALLRKIPSFFHLLQHSPNSSALFLALCADYFVVHAAAPSRGITPARRKEPAFSATCSAFSRPSCPPNYELQPDPPDAQRVMRSRTAKVTDPRACGYRVLYQTRRCRRSTPPACHIKCTRKYARGKPKHNHDMNCARLAPRAGPLPAGWALRRPSAWWRAATVCPHLGRCRIGAPAK